MEVFLELGEEHPLKALREAAEEIDEVDQVEQDRDGVLWILSAIVYGNSIRRSGLGCS
jgi:hypothetical protein